MAIACETNADDEWIFHSEEYIADAQAALDAAGVPDLLAALEKLVQQVESGYFDHVATDHPNSAVIAARAAIAKATGGAA
jgi:hypothetical protein